MATYSSSLKNGHEVANHVEYGKNTFQFTLAAMDAKRADEATYSIAYVKGGLNDNVSGASSEMIAP